MLLFEVALFLSSRQQRLLLLKSSLIGSPFDLRLRDLNLTNLCSNDLRWRCFYHLDSVLLPVGLKLVERTFVFLRSGKEILTSKGVWDFRKEVWRFCQGVFVIFVSEAKIMA